MASSSETDRASMKLTVSAIRRTQPTGKRFRLDHDGSIVKEQLSRGAGVAIHREVTWSEDLDFLEEIANGGAHTELLSGTWTGPECDGMAVVTKARRGEGQLAATKDFLEHRPVPGVLRIDVDVKKRDDTAGIYPDEPLPFAYDAARAMILDILPEAEDVAMVIRDSSSAMISNADGELLVGRGGLRIEMPVTNASRIPQFLELLFDRAWARGHGWSFVSSAGQILHRGPVDMALARPTQPDFVVPDLHDGLNRRSAELVKYGANRHPLDVARASNTTIHIH